ncbi:MAG: hypothetical protein ACRD0Q_02420 [Acidimicrobiales bacterium]
MRKRFAGLLTAALITGGLLVTSPVRVGAQAVSDQPFSASGTGTAVHVGALRLGTTEILNTEVAYSGGSANSKGLPGVINNEFGQTVQPAQPGKNSYGRGTGLELGVGTTLPSDVDRNALNLSERAEANAAPNLPMVTKEIPIDLDPVAYASTARGQAQAIFDPTYCPVGRPLSFGLGYVENLELLNTTSGVRDANGGFGGQLLGTSVSQGNPRGASQSRTVTYLAPNGDGTFGVVSETRQTVAPITALGDLNNGLIIEIAGEFGLKATATGKPGGSSVVYTGNPVVTIKTVTLGVELQVLQLTLQQLLGNPGLNVNLAPVAEVSVGAPPRAIGSAPAAPSPAVAAANGTAASGAVDTVRLKVLNLPGLMGLDLSLGHMEATANAPAGGVRCQIPVSKAASPDPVQVGQEVTFTIKIPSDAAFFSTLFNCDLVGIKATDTHESTTGGPRVILTSAEPGGRIVGNQAIFDNLGSYRLGDPPIVLTIRGRIPSNSRSGVLRDTVDVTAALGNCRGGAAGEDIVRGGATFDGSAIVGRVTLVGPNVTGGDLAATGGTSLPLVLGGGLGLLALGLFRLRRRAGLSD